LVHQQPPPQCSDRKHNDQLKTPLKHTIVAKTTSCPTDMTTKATT
jgi:hypothetical protein